MIPDLTPTARAGPPTPFTRLGSLGHGAVTAVALAAQTALSAGVGVVLGRTFGHGPVTDGFIAAHGVFVVALLAANAVRVKVLPSLARARLEGRFGAEVGATATVLAAVAGPVLLMGSLAARPVTGLLVGGQGGLASSTAAQALPWMLLAAALKLFAGLAASALAALDDYATAALGYAFGGAAGLGLILVRVPSDGVAALSHGIALSGAVSLAVPAVALAIRSRALTGAETHAPPSRLEARSRLSEMGYAVALPLSLQAIYLVSVPFAARESSGAVTSFGFAYLISSAMVTVTASSLGLVTAVPLARGRLDAPGAARHVIASGWVALVAVVGAAGVFAVGGEPLARAALGSSYAKGVGSELGRLVAVLAPWALVSVGLAATFPLLFVAGRGARLPLIGLSGLALHVPLAWAGRHVLGLEGLALALAVTKAAILGAALFELGALRSVSRGLGRATGILVAYGVVAFVPFSFLLPAPAAAAAGLAAYSAGLALARPAGLRHAWRYLRTLG
jgi:hypothetical protein